MKGIFISCACIFLCLVSCLPAEDVGLAQYFIRNNGNDTIEVKLKFIPSVSETKTFYTIAPGEMELTGKDANFGHAPQPSEVVDSLFIYVHDSLSYALARPCSDTLWLIEAGEGEYDRDFTFVYSL